MCRSFLALSSWEAGSTKSSKLGQWVELGILHISIEILVVIT